MVLSVGVFNVYLMQNVLMHGVSSDILYASSLIFQTSVFSFSQGSYLKK